jgi:hypothetical protein
LLSLYMPMNMDLNAPLLKLYQVDEKSVLGYMNKVFRIPHSMKFLLLFIVTQIVVLITMTITRNRRHFQNRHTL